MDDLEHVRLPHAGRRQHSHVRWYFGASPEEPILIDGLLSAGVSSALVEVSRAYDDAHLLSVLDSVARTVRLTSGDRERIRAGVRHDRHWLLNLADGRRESPLESRTALLMHADGITGVVPQVELWLPEVGRVRLDFEVGEGVAVECDGREVHAPLAQQYKDRRRQEALERVGFIVVRVTWADVVHRPNETCARIRAAMRDAELRRLRGSRVAARPGR